ncbi:MAG: hypothetical protein IPF92_06810 [Myxococcales bacterium]|nr:hypothetical protein [Myxococcales bacterium]
MTAQSPERFSSAHATFQPGAWRVYGLIRGAPTEANHGWGERAEDGRRVKVYRADPGAPPATTSANWKGYTEVLHLGADGRLTLVRFDYASRELPSRVVNERITGDFFLVLKATFRGPRLYVRFRDGVLEDAAAWLHEESTPGTFERTLREGAHPDFPDAPEH